MKKCRLLSVLFFLFFTSCGKNQYDNFPYVLVDAKFSLQDPKFSSLKTKGTSVDVKEATGNVQGVGGLILYNNSGVIMAYDKRSPASIEQQCNVVLNSAFTCEDKCAGVIFQLSDGNRISGSSGMPLVRYSVSVMAGDMIRVTN